MPAPLQSVCPEVDNNPRFCPVDLELSAWESLHKHQLQKYTVILLCNYHVFTFTTWKTISIHAIVFTRNPSAKQVGREYVSLFTKSSWKTIIGFDDIWQFIKFTLMKLNLKMDCTFPALTCCRIGLKMSCLEAKATREVALIEELHCFGIFPKV